MKYKKYNLKRNKNNIYIFFLITINLIYWNIILKTKNNIIYIILDNNKFYFIYL